MSLTDSNIDTKQAAPPKKRRLLWRVLLVSLLCFIILFLIAWSQRFSLIERTARHKLAEKNITADFSIRRITLEHAEIDNIRLSRAGQDFFSAKRLSATYNWREAINLKFNEIEVQGPKLNLEIDSSGNIISDWMPKPSGSSGESMLPAKKIAVKNGRVNLASPYANLSANIDAEVTSLRQVYVKLHLEPAPFTYNEISGQAGGDFEVIRDGDIIEAKISLLASEVKSDQFSGRGLTVQGPVTLDLGVPRRTLTSNLDVKFKEAGLPDMKLGSGSLTWKGIVTEPGNNGEALSLYGDWAADIQKAQITNPERRTRLAESLTLNSTLMNISSVAPLAPPLTAKFEEFLTGSDISTAGRIDVSNERQTISLTQDAVVRKNLNPKNYINIAPSPEGRPVFQYDVDSQNMILTADVELGGSLPISLKNATLLALSENGRGLSNLQSFDADLQTHTSWRAKTPAGKPVRLAPMRAKIAFETNGETSLIKLGGGITFDGDVPGGYVTNAKARGAVSLRLVGDTHTANFTPTRGSVVTISRVETDTEWALEDLEFGLKSTGAPLYKRNSQFRKISTELLAAKGRLINTASAKEMDFDFKQADVGGAIVGDVQNWTLNANGAHMTSDSFPGPETEVFAPRAILTAKLEPGESVSFTADSPKASVSTLMVSAKDMKVSASGTPDNILANFSQGLVKFSAGELPELPVSGAAKYDGLGWSGTAQVNLPRAAETPIDITYEFADGVGTADVHFEDLQFKPGGLQPKHLVSAISGMVSRVKGGVSSDIQLSFGADLPLQSSGTLTIKDMEASTLPGPLSGMNAQIKFSSFFPLETDGPQTLFLGGFDPGFPLVDGDIRFELIPDGVKLEQARWPLGTGSINLQPTVWLYTAPQNRVTLGVENVQLGEFLKNVGGGKFSATGAVNGVLPVLIEGVKVHVENGRLGVKDGGVIQYQSPQTDVAADANAYAGYAFDALKNFKYQELEAELNGPLDGLMKLRMKFDGSNPKVLYGSEFGFNIGVEGELLNIVRSFQVGSTIEQSILEQIQAQSERQNESQNENMPPER